MSFLMKNEYGRLSLKAVMELAAPHTWGASIMPVILGSVLSLAFTGTFSFALFYSLLLTSVFLQCAVNTFNDYSDFIKGTDTEENSDDPSDAPIVSNKINPNHAFRFGMLFLLLAFISGLYTLLTAGWELLIFGGIGVAVVILYSFGKKPAAYLPIGEMVSGFTMGGIIPLACFYAYTGIFDLRILFYSIPLIMTIGMIMFTNNLSDIERDSEVGRKTLPILIGRENSKKLHLVIVVIIAVIMLVFVYKYFIKGMPLTPLALILIFFPEYWILKGGLVPEVRKNSMQGIIQIHWRLNLMYIAMIVANTIQ